MKNSNSVLLATSMEELANLVRTKKTGIITVKPKVLFSNLETSNSTPVPLNLYIPSSEMGSITLLEAASLVSLLAIIKPSKIFEFGTFLGYSTALLTKNSTNDCKVISLDLGEEITLDSDIDTYTENELRTNDKKNDDYLRKVQSRKGTHYLNNLTPDEESRLKLLLGDSKELDVDELNLEKQIDFIFVDGGHDTETILKDAENAEKMVTTNGLIVWHDYNSNIHSDVTHYINNYALDNLVIHIENTMLACCFYGNSLSLLTSD